MIDEAAVESAIIQIVQGSGLFANILYEGQIATPTKPYLTLAVMGTGVTDDTIAQTDPVWSGIISAGIVTDLDKFATEGRALAKAFGELFKSGTRFQIGAGVNVTVQGHPFAASRYRDGAGYRQPIVITLRSEYLAA